jgi:hypothetical protein
MTSDISGSVVGIQGNPIDAETLSSSEDGYVLTWDNTDGYWVARPEAVSGFRQAYFASGGVWTCPVGVSSVLLIGAGGGGGGGGGSGGAGTGHGGGGGGAGGSGFLYVLY